MVRFASVCLSYYRKSDQTGASDTLRDVSFDLAQGSFRWLLGESGSGKTTLLKLMSLSLRPTHGEAVVLGTSWTSMRWDAMPRLRRQIGVIFEDFRLLPQLSVFDNVALPLRLAGRPEGQVRADVLELLRWIGLTAKLVSTPKDLSNGERQRVAIARAVIGRPKLLLADEPTSWLDIVHRDRVILLLRELNRLGSTVIIATHSEWLAARYPGPELRLSNGSVTAAN